MLGILTGMRGLCNGLGPALFGLFFYFSHVHLKEMGSVTVGMAATGNNDIHGVDASIKLINGTMLPDAYEVPFQQIIINFCEVVKI